MAENPIQAMLVNVGGAAAPAIHTLNEQRPRFICFFVSGESRQAIQERILPALGYTPEHYDWIETPAAQNLLACYQALAERLPPVLEKWGVAPETLAVEFTAGTKPMSVAAVLATVEATSSYFYVGAGDPSGRDRDGIGVVLDGREFTWFQSNPWEVLAVRARDEIALLFNAGRFTDARERAERLARVAPEMKGVYTALAELVEAYALWDRFEYKSAQNWLSKAYHALRLYTAGRDDPLRATLDVVEEHLAFLRALSGKDEREAARLDFLDLLANATRRAEKAGKYDDAVARLYSALEGLARDRLRFEHGIVSGRVPPEKVPESLRDDYIRRFGDPVQPGAELRLGLEAAYNLLAELGDELGQRYLSAQTELEQVLHARNQSRLAHGKQPVRPEIYTRMRAILMGFAGVNERELPRFPELYL